MDARLESDLDLIITLSTASPVMVKITVKITKQYTLFIFCLK